MILMLAAAILAILASVLVIVMRSASNRNRKADQERLDNDEAERIAEQASRAEAARRRRIEDHIRASDGDTAIATPSALVEPAIDHADEQQHAEAVEDIAKVATQQDAVSASPSNMAKGVAELEQSIEPAAPQEGVHRTLEASAKTPGEVELATKSSEAPNPIATNEDQAISAIATSDEIQLVVADAVDAVHPEVGVIGAEGGAETAPIELVPSLNDLEPQQSANGSTRTDRLATHNGLTPSQDVTQSDTSDVVAANDRQSDELAARAAAKLELRRQFDERRSEIAEQEAAHAAAIESLRSLTDEDQIESKTSAGDDCAQGAVQDPIAESARVTTNTHRASAQSNLVDQGDGTPAAPFQEEVGKSLLTSTLGEYSPSDSHYLDAQPVEAESPVFTKETNSPKDAGESDDSRQIEAKQLGQGEESAIDTDPPVHSPSADGALDIDASASQRTGSVESLSRDAPPSSNEVASQVLAVDSPQSQPDDSEVPGIAADEISLDIEAPDQDKARARLPRRYQPLARTGQARPQRDTSSSRAVVERAGEVEVRLVVERGGYCRVGLLPRRQASMPAELAVSGSGGRHELNALQENWYQDVLPDELGNLLRGGIEWAGKLPDGSKTRLALSGREVFVLTRHDEINGFVSVPRLLLGEEHVVLCAEERLEDVLSQLHETGSPVPTIVSSELGAPKGWLALRGVVPKDAVTPSEEGSILDALCPRPEVELALVGGVRIDRNTWLLDYPPELRILGAKDAVRAITIDGREALLAASGSYVAEGWDGEGDHQFSCSEGTRTYSIRSGCEVWLPWEVQHLPLRKDCSSQTASICGALVRPPEARPDARVVVVPHTNSILVGASPGQIEVCHPRSDIRSSSCIGLPSFAPVWALPADPRNSDKRRVHAIFLGEGDSHSYLPNADTQAATATSSKKIHAWCVAILRSGRKGLTASPGSSETAQLWKNYRRVAKRVEKARR